MHMFRQILMYCFAGLGIGVVLLTAGCWLIVGVENWDAWKHRRRNR